ncbi:MAG TPA: hypothetical protein PLK90_08945 [Clostridiales bacterium]|nr:hypothetical protein [Clostridiales bacterium]HQP70511.1 hypothetical protein [Clostridiales bacterium]
MKKTSVFMLIMVTLLFAQMPKASINIPCSAYQGFNFDTFSHENVGHVTYMKISDVQALVNDLTVVNPISYPQTVQVAGVMRDIYWEGGVGDPIQMSFLVSTANKQTVAMLLSGTMQNTEVEFDFNVYSYDNYAHTYFKAFYPVNNAHLLGLIQESGGELYISIEDEPDAEIEQPTVFLMTIGIMPQDITQQLLVGISSTQSVVKQWGIGVPPPDPPGGIIIGPVGPGLWLNWDDVAGATSYDIYSSDDPYGTYTFVTNVTVSEYQISEVLQKRFYYVVAKN